MKTLTTLLLTLSILTATTAQTIHVTPTGSGTGTGAGWANATTLETAVSVATSGTAIWVQAGTYNLSATLVVPQGVRVYGGFAGTETTLSQRNFATNRTIINANQQFAAVTLSPLAVLSGVTVQNGVANIPARTSGGGVLMGAGSRIEYSYILNNIALISGGGVYATANAEIFNSVIANNRAGVSGFAAAGAQVSFRNNTVTANSLLDCEPYRSEPEEETICAGETVMLSASQMGTFVWSTGATTPFITTPVLTTSTTFTVAITLPNFCVVTDTFHIIVNPTPVVTIAVNPPSANPFDMVTFTATATPPGGTFLWSDISGTTTPTLTQQMPATGDLQFTVNYTLNGCDALPVTATATNTDCVPPSIAGATLTADDSSLCVGNSTTLRLTGGTRNSGYWVLFSGACGGVEISRTNLNSPTFSVSPTTATTFFVRGEGCEIQTACVQVAVTVLPLPLATTAPSNTVCLGQNITLTNPTAGGGTWSIGLEGGLSVVTEGPNSVTVTGTAAGDRTVVFTATNGCQHIFNLEVLAGPMPIVGDTNLCQGQSRTFTAMPTGGTWSTAGGGSATVNAIGQVTASPTLTGATVIQYTHPATGCFVQQTVFVHQQPATPSAVSNQVCIGDFVVLNPPSPAGGTWSISPANLAEFNPTFTQITGLVAGTATVTYQLNAHCSASFELTVLPAALPFSHVFSICAGATSTPTASQPGGTWSSTNTTIATVNPTTGAFTGVSAGTFSLVYTLPTGCAHTSAPITIEPSPVITGSSAVGVGLTTPLTVSPAGGTWMSFNPAVASVDAAGLVTGVSAGTTTIRHTIGGCLADHEITVDACAMFTLATGSADQEVCLGGTMLNITYNLTNASVSQISWSPTTPTGINFNTATHTISGTPSVPGTFTYTITSVNHPVACSPASVSGTITVFPAVMPGVIAGTTLNICQGTAPAEFTSTSAGSGGNPIGGTHQWQLSSDNITWSNIAGATSPNHQATALNATTHFRRVFNNACGSVNSNVITVNVNLPPPTPTATTTPNTVCVGTPDGSITITTTGVTGFSLNGTTFQASPTFTGLSGGSHTIFVQNAAGCISSASVTIANQAGNPELVGGVMTVTPGTTICNPHAGGNIVISPTFTGAGASPTFSWSVVGGASGISTLQSLTLTTPPTTTTTYRITVTNTQNNCVAYFDQTITVVNPPTITTQPVGGSICVGQTAITLNVGVSPPGGHTYQWQSSATETGTFVNTGQTASSFTVPNNPASALWYRAQVSMVGGICPPIYSSAVQVSVLAVPSIATTTPGATCGEGTVALLATANPATASIRWFSTATGGSPIGTTASGATWTTPHITTTTQYFAEAYNVGLCASVARTSVTATIAQPHTITPSGGALTQSVCQGAPINAITFTPGGSATGTTISWSGASASAPTGITFSGNQLSGAVGAAAITGVYTFTVTTTPSGGTCSPVTSTGSITVNAPPPAVTVAQVPGCAYVTLNATGAGGTIYWQGTTSGGTSTATPSASQTVTATGTYFFRARSAEGCWGTQGSATVTTILQPHTLTANSPSVNVNAAIPANTVIATRGGSATEVTITWDAGSAPAGINVSALTGATITITGTPTVTGSFGFTVATVANACPAHTPLTGTVTVTVPMTGCNSATPLFGGGATGVPAGQLGTVTWGNTSNTNIEVGTTTVTRAGTPPANTGTGTNTQVWSGAVFAQGCAKGNATNNNAFSGGSTGNFNADCRQSLHTFNAGRAAGITGDLFSWCAVMRFADVLCPPAQGWRVPSTDDFRRLHWILTGNVPPAPGGGVAHPANSYIGTAGTAAAAQVGGQWGGARFTGNAGNLTIANSIYWSSTENDATNARSLLFNASSVWPESWGNKAIGFALRCVR